MSFMAGCVGGCSAPARRLAAAGIGAGRWCGGSGGCGRGAMEGYGDDDVMVVKDMCRGQGKGEWGRDIGEDLIFIVWIGVTAFPSSDQTD